MIERLSRKQLRLVEHAYSDKTTCLAGGAMRSGKSLATIFAFGINVGNNMGYDHALCGLTVEVIMRNVGFDLIQFLRNLGYGAELRKDFGTRIAVSNQFEETSIWLFGANDDRSWRKVRGSTLGSVFIDESVEIPQDMFKMIWSRLTLPNSKLWCTYNPDNPWHWFKEDVIDRVEDYNGVLYNFDFNDNPWLSQEYKDRMMSGLTGHWKARMVDGDWAGASGLIYPKFSKELHTFRNPRTIFGLDWGAASVTCALKIQVERDKANVIDEWYYDATDGVPRTDTEHKDSFINWANSVASRVYADPSTSASFKRLIRESGYQLINANNAVVKGLRHTGELLASGKLRISTSCQRTIRELHQYQWDTQKTKATKRDTPMKHNDHLMDCLRYAAMTHMQQQFTHPISTNILYGG